MHRYKLRRVPWTFAVVAVLAFSYAYAPHAEAGRTCTRVGTDSRDKMYGSRHSDVMCLKAGRDYGNARGANDILKGGPDADTLVGGPGGDTIHGLQGPDDLFATDENGNDTLDGGTGNDNCYGDFGDTFLQSCEHVVRV